MRSRDLTSWARPVLHTAGQKKKSATTATASHSEQKRSWATDFRTDTIQIEFLCICCCHLKSRNLNAMLELCAMKSTIPNEYCLMNRMNEKIIEREQNKGSKSSTENDSRTESNLRRKHKILGICELYWTGLPIKQNWISVCWTEEKKTFFSFGIIVMVYDLSMAHQIEVERAKKMKISKKKEKSRLEENKKKSRSETSSIQINNKCTNL